MALNVNFKVSGGNATTFSLHLEPALTIEAVKLLAAEQCSMEANLLKIIYKGRILKDPDTLEGCNVESGQTMHVVRSAAPGAAPPTAPVAPVIATPAQVAATPGVAAPPAAGGFGATGMEGMFSPDMMQMAMQMMQGGNMGQQPGATGAATGTNPGMGPMGMDPNQIEQMMSNPMVQQMMQNLSNNPQMLQQMIQSNPMLQQMSQQDPMFAQVLQNPQMLQQMFNPQTMQAMLQMRQMMGNMPGLQQQPGMAGMPPAGNTPFAGGAPTPNPFANPEMAQMMQQMMGGGGMGGGMGMPADNRPGEERFATQIEQLQNMGFADQPSNLQALQMANGDVNQAINFLLGGGQ